MAESSPAPRRRSNPLASCRSACGVSRSLHTPGPEVRTWRELSDPEPGLGENVVEVAAQGGIEIDDSTIWEITGNGIHCSVMHLWREFD